MQKLRNSLQNFNFSHIYIEKSAKHHPNTEKILTHFKNAIRIEIDHYKDVFNRGHQSFTLQKQSPKLILATKKDNLIYKGAEVCEDFGNKYFYYTSSMMNCIYDCEYCYLQGMYPSANIVIFVNLEDILTEVERLLKKHPVYLCISYDTDLLAFEGIISFVASWFEFASQHSDLTIELRTKSANFNAIKHIAPLENVILAWTLSPAKVINAYEAKTPSFTARLHNIGEAIEAGWRVRLCFDPLLYVKDWQEQYKQCINQTFETLSPEKIYDVSIGVFRVSRDYLKKIQKERIHSVLLAYPFECNDGVCTYSERHTKQLIDFVYQRVCRYVRPDKIYR
ncbi:MAG: hypothetical protein PWP27_959 [Clostridiales bacterium]|nr:hypothetical protein [Clostridiales bacterium]MDK2933149.1 hypothetical protein [Clostridiales bacterium]